MQWPVHPYEIFMYNPASWHYLDKTSLSIKVWFVMNIPLDNQSVLPESKEVAAISSVLLRS